MIGSQKVWHKGKCNFHKLKMVFGQHCYYSIFTNQVSQATQSSMSSIVTCSAKTASNAFPL